MDMAKSENLIMIAAVGVVGYFLYKGVKKVGQVATTAVNATGQAIANLWVSVWDPVGAGQVLGNVLFPDGSYVPTSQLPLKSGNDPSGNWGLFTQYQGHIYQLSPSDINGDFPATLMS